MAKARRRVNVRHRLRLGRLLGKLSPLDNVLDYFLLLTPLLAVAPPHWPLVVAPEAEVLACLASGFAFLALFPPQSASKATWNSQYQPATNYVKRGIPERERRCIFVATALASDELFLDAAILACCLDVLLTGAEEDMNVYVQESHCELQC